MIEPIPFHKVISSVRLSFYKRRGNSFPEMAYTAFNEKSDLIELLFDYHEKIGVEGYDQDHEQVLWLIKNNWYTTEQINRMLHLKAFM